MTQPLRLELTSCEDESFNVQTGHENVDSLADPSHHVALRHFAVLKDKLASIGAAHPQLVQLLSRFEPFHSCTIETKQNFFLTCTYNPNLLVIYNKIVGIICCYRLLSDFYKPSNKSMGNHKFIQI